MKKSLYKKIKSKNLLIHLFLLIYISAYEIPNRNGTIILPLNIMKISLNKFKKEKFSDTLNLLINEIVPNNLYINLKIDFNKIEIPAYLTFNSPYNFFEVNSCIDLDKRIEYNNTRVAEKLSEINLFNNIYQNYFYLQENITINANNKNFQEINLNKMDLIISENNKRKAECIILGLNPSIENNTKLDNFPMALKMNNNYINHNSYLTILYNNSQYNNKILNITNDSLLIFGAPVHILLPNIFNIKNYKEIDNFYLKKSYEEFYSKSFQKNSWSLEINNIYFNDIEISKDLIGLFSVDYTNILLPMELFRYYIDFFMEKYSKICYKKGRPLSRKFTHSLDSDKKQIFIFLYCDKNKIENLTEFYYSIPIFKLRSDSLGTTFEFSGKELFIEDENFTSLIIMPDLFSQKRITLGKIFMEKYIFSFNYDTNKIGFYKNEIQKGKKINKLFINNFSFIIYQVLIMIFLGILLFFINNFMKKKNDIEKIYQKNKTEKINNNIKENFDNEEELIEINEEDFTK